MNLSALFSWQLREAFPFKINVCGTPECRFLLLLVELTNHIRHCDDREISRWQPEPGNAEDLPQSFGQIIHSVKLILLPQRCGMKTRKMCKSKECLLESEPFGGIGALQRAMNYPLLISLRPRDPQARVNLSCCHFWSHCVHKLFPVN